MDDEFVDLVVTSPPYDQMRDYKKFTFDFKKVASELFRITKKGGVCVWIVGDQTIKGNETGTSFSQALYFKQIGFNLFDTMIYAKKPRGAVGNNQTYWQTFDKVLPKFGNIKNFTKNGSFTNLWATSFSKRFIFFTNF